jgi:hypothetical protein
MGDITDCNPKNTAIMQISSAYYDVITPGVLG